MARSKTQQSAHDKQVKGVAQSLKRQGYDVRADVPGFKKPPTLGGYRPDVVAEKGKSRKIIEVETPDSKGSKRDCAQQKAFRRVADRSKSTTFRREITDR